MADDGENDGCPFDGTGCCEMLNSFVGVGD